jgi:hypothetical protein
VKRFILAIVGVISLAVPGATLAHEGHRPSGPSVVVQWNQTLLNILNTPGNQPATVHPTRSMAILHLAIFDGIRAAGHGASRSAAADGAAHKVLVTLFPAQQQTLDTQFGTLLAQVPDTRRRDAGVAIGERAAAAVLAARADDGSTVTPPAYDPGPNPKPGVYRLTPPNNAPAVFTHWAAVTPFALRHGAQFRPGPPPALTSHAYAAALNEVQSLGDVNSTTRTAEQTTIGKFWAPPIQNFWNQIAETIAIQHHDRVKEDAALFAALDVTLADSAIAMYDAKYTYAFWRPVTAIQATSNPTWLPLAGNTAADPSYVGAHSTISAAAGTVLAAFFGDRDHFDVTSSALPNVTRSFDRISAAVDEAGLSRIYAGQHFRFDDVAGRALGRSVAAFDLPRVLFGHGRR